MSEEKVPTADQLIALAGLNESPSEIVREAQIEWRKAFGQQRVRVNKWYNRYTIHRRKHLEGTSRLGTVVLSVFAWSFLFVLGFCAWQGIWGVLIAGLLPSLLVSCVIGPKMFFWSALDPIVFFVKEEGPESYPLPIIPARLLRERYIAGLVLVTDQLIGPNSDWSRSLNDLRSRLDNVRRHKTELTNRIQTAYADEDDDRYLALTGVGDRLKSSERGLIEAAASMEALIAQTKAEIDKLYYLIDRARDAYADAEFIAEIDQIIDGNAGAINHAKDLSDQVYEKISRQLMAVAATVIGHKLLPNPNVDAIDMPRYLEEIEHAATAIVQIGEA